MFIIDMKDTKNHTVLNGNKIGADIQYPIQSGDEISIGKNTYVIEIKWLSYIYYMNRLTLRTVKKLSQPFWGY